MFIIISYIMGTYDNLHIVLSDNEDGKPATFSSYDAAEKYAKEKCAFSYKIVGL